MSKRSATYKKRREMAAMAREAKRRTKDVEQPGEALSQTPASSPPPRKRLPSLERERIT